MSDTLNTLIGRLNAAVKALESLAGDFATLTASPPAGESAEHAVVLANSQQVITDSKLITWAISATGVVVRNGVADSTTSRVTSLAYHNHTVYQRNADGGWWSWNGSAWIDASDPFATGTGGFAVVNGKITGPDGQNFVARGVNAGSETIGGGVVNGANLQRLFPGISILRLATGNYTSVDQLTPFVNDLTAHKIITLIEHHPWPIPQAYTGGDLTAESNWYASLASAFKDNPYVWFGTMNEPQGGDISGQHLATYKAIRGAGANNIILFDMLGGGNPNTINGNYLNVGVYQTMKNVGADLHFYPWMTNAVLGNYSTDQDAVTSVLLGSASTGTGIAAVQVLRTADGVMPVVIGEFGPSEDGVNTHPNSDQCLNAVAHSGHGFIAWCMTPGGALGLVDNNGALSGYGRQIAGLIAGQ